MKFFKGKNQNKNKEKNATDVSNGIGCLELRDFGKKVRTGKRSIIQMPNKKISK